MVYRLLTGPRNTVYVKGSGQSLRKMQAKMLFPFLDNDLLYHNSGLKECACWTTLYIYISGCLPKHQVTINIYFVNLSLELKENFVARKLITVKTF